SWMASPLLLAASLGERITRKGNSHQFFAPVSVFATRDGYVYVAVGSDLQWAALEKLPGFEALARPAYATNAGRIPDAPHLERELGKRFAGLATEEALGVLRDAGVRGSGGAARGPLVWWGPRERKRVHQDQN